MMDKKIIPIVGLSLLLNSFAQARIIWDDGGDTSEWSEAENWNPNIVPGTAGFDNCILHLGRSAFVSSAITTAAKPDILVRQGGRLVIRANMNSIRQIGLGLHSYNGWDGGKIIHSGGTVTTTWGVKMGHSGFVGDSKALYRLRNNATLNAEDLLLYEGSHFWVEGSNCSVNLSDDLTVNSKGFIRYVLSSSSAGVINVNDRLTIDSSGAVMEINAAPYTGGEATFELINYGSRSGEFAEKNVSISGLADGLTAYIEYDSNSVNLIIREDSPELSAVLALGQLTTAPAVYAGASPTSAVRTVAAGEKKYIYYDALDYAGKSTRVFTWLGIPAGASASNKVPAIVLVHGGGGTAFEGWVDKWVARGYAAISMSVEGHTSLIATPEMIAAGKSVGNYYKHAMHGPARLGIYRDSNEALTDQWMYHAVADTILANSLMRSLPEVDASKVGMMGVSWGGVIASTVMGIDNRFAFAIPTYGCGHLYDSGNVYGSSLVNNSVYRDVWDPVLRIYRADMPALWLSWPEDQHFSIVSQSQTYTEAPGARMVSLIPGMGHGHASAWNVSDSYEFADSIIAAGVPWCTQTSISRSGSTVTAVFNSTKTLNSAELISTTTGDGVYAGDRVWTNKSAVLTNNGNGSWTVTVSLPVNSKTWFVNVKSGNLIVTSDLQQ